MKRGGMQSQEVKDLTTRLNQANVMNNSIIFIERGTPTTPNQYRILFSLATPPKAVDSKASCYSFIELFDIPVDATISILDIKKHLSQKINSMFPSMNVDYSKIRLRERNSDRLSKALRNADTLKNYAIYEKKMISIQVLDSPEEEIPTNNMIIIGKR